MGSRTELQTLLETTLGSDAVYFQPPPTLKMVYPCILYERSYLKTEFANNSLYSIGRRYTLTVITKDPDSTIPEQILNLSQCAFDRHFVTDNLYHDVFTIYF